MYIKNIFYVGNLEFLRTRMYQTRPNSTLEMKKVYKL